MDKEKRSMLVGLTIGDGHISPNGTLYYTHCLKQKDYLEYKLDIVHSILGGKRPKVREINNNGYPGVATCKSNTKLKAVRNILYKNGKKCLRREVLDTLSPHAIAIWYMDDGCIAHKKRNGKIHSRDIILNTHLTRDENQIIIDYFSETHNVKFTQVLNRGLYRLRCGVAEGRKFISLIEPYIIPSMQYKIDMKYPVNSKKAGHP